MVGSGLGETSGSAVGAATTATADGAASALGPGVDQPPSGNVEQPPKRATTKITTSSGQSGRAVGRDRMRDSLGSQRSTLRAAHVRRYSR
jgi:hypothetical protein